MGALLDFRKRIDRSQLVLGVVPEKFTKGIGKKLITQKARYTWGLETTYVYGNASQRTLARTTQQVVIAIPALFAVRSNPLKIKSWRTDAAKALNIRIEYP